MEKNALFEAFPVLAERVPHTPFAQLPTPIEAMETLGERYGLAGLYVKRDDLSAQAYGGNKVRKLEFLLADARKKGKKTVMTFGAAGSNHALATALYARQLGLRCVNMLVPQPNAYGVRKNLLLSHRAGAELHYGANIPALVMQSLGRALRISVEERSFPYIIPAGGSSPHGLLGYVAAGFELARQIEEGRMPVPDLVYVAWGTMGTAIGLSLGIEAAGLPSRVMAVRVTDPLLTSERGARRLFGRTNRLLTQSCPAFPRLAFPRERFTLRHEFFGEEYARFTEEGLAAMDCAREECGLRLEGTYTGKTFAALLHDAAQGALAGKQILFWNTCNSRDFSEEIAGLDYKKLPTPFHRYFERDVQPGDTPQP